MIPFKTYYFNFDRIKRSLIYYQTERKIEYLKWIIKEYNLAGCPHKVKLTNYKNNPDKYYAYTGDPAIVPYEYYEDKFIEKIRIELEYHEEKQSKIIGDVPNIINIEGKTKITEKVNMKKNKIFISYSHEESAWLKRIQKHIKTLQLEGIEIDLWDDTKLKGGDDWKKEVEKALSNSYIAILLITTNFLASDFIVKNELPPILENAEQNQTVIKPLVLSPCRFTKNKMLSKYHSINDPEKEVLTEMKRPTQERILLRLMDEMVEIIEKCN